ncbi:MAG: PD-(D/E)XK nuclease family protein [Bacteroidales bacterium]|nr:PD-(D/E)XK nuclease family protein [Bacteroidales bacterium]
MEKFLHQVANHIWKKHNGNLGNVLVVFNNRRAGLFLREHLMGLDDKPYFMPNIKGMDELVADLGGAVIMPHEFLLFELYDIHRRPEHNWRKFDTFEEFIPMGEMMIGDFSEIDLYMVDAAQIMKNLYEQKQLGEWDIEGTTQSEFQKNYLEFYNSLITYYNELRKKLSLKQCAYTGMAYRNVAENIESLARTIQYEHIYFVGFNALSKSEETIIDYLVKLGKGEVLSDGDKYYYEDPCQEAGHFLRLQSQKYPGVSSFDDNFGSEHKTIHIINCPENILQAKVIGSIVDSAFSNQKANKELAVVLADENLILPVLNSLPSNVNSANVTMGFPYTLTGIHSTAIKLLTLFTHTRNGKYYHTDITALLSDDLINKTLHTNNLHSLVSEKLNDGKIIYASREELATMLEGTEANERLPFLFADDITNADTMLSVLHQLSEAVFKSGAIDNDVKEREALACFVQILNHLDQLQKRYTAMEKIETLQRIYQRLSQCRSVAFYGEPLNGIQILGMLETRSIDFDKVAILSVNEGKLPAARSNSSLIPFSLKRAFGLPTFEERDAVYAYNFYRLLQRSKEIWLLYSSDTEDTGKGEPSRFILQIRDELSKRFKNITISEETVAVDNSTEKNGEEPAMVKNDKVIKRLEEMAKKGFSPSALNRYRGCPMQFYYTDILKIKEQEELSENLEENELGSLIHDILHTIYDSSKNKIVKTETLENAYKDVDTMVDALFNDKILKGRSPEGKNRLYSEVAKMQIKHFLKNEIKTLESHSIEIILAEDPMCESIKMKIGDIESEVHIQGIVDRVDKLDGTLRIADYKSGGVQSSDLRAPIDIQDPRELPDKWFQVMTYAWLYCSKYHYKGDFEAGIIPLRSLNGDFMTTKWGQRSIMSNDDIEHFEIILKKLLSNIMDPSVPFEANPQKKVCNFCPIANSCRNKIIQKDFK